MKYAKIVNFTVIQIQPNKEDGFVEIDDDVVCGMIQTETGFENPPKNIKDAKDEKTNEINTACGNEIISGFTSDALGSTHSYQSTELDQLNLIGVVTAQQDDYFKCGVADADGVIAWDWKLHTVAQLTQALQDGKVHKQVLLKKANDLKVQIENATTLDELDLIGW